ncbi:MAG TPA: LPS export ABC transporter periplasmic protein LptC, partial [Gemmatimonadaceae bacterium]|nr:LPS export ABC transporter periplasmic protein LptC [Gemmatimonadaceae bacterium]
MRPGLVVGAAVAAIGLVACAQTAKPPTETKAVLPDSADQVLFGVVSPMTDLGVMRGMLFADTMFVLNDENRFDLRMTHMSFNTETGEPKGTMRADRGMFDQRTKVLEGWGNVVVTLVDGRSLRSPHVTYDMLRALISSDTNYVIAGGGRSQFGIGFTTDTGFNNFHCLHACGGQMPVPMAGK